jgi:hypothetical protein
MYQKAIFVAVAVLGAAASTYGATATFDDGLADLTAIPNGYAGLSWNNLYALNGTTYFGNPSGYFDGRVSGDFVAYNGFGSPASFGLEPSFTVNSFYLTAAWLNDLDVLIEGLLDGSQVFSTSIQIDTTIQSLVTLNWSGIDEVRLTTSGGVEGYDTDGTHFAMDNLVINSEFVPEVPEAGTWFAGASVAFIGGATYFRRRR